MPLDNILDLFFSLFGGPPMFYFFCSLIIVPSVIGAVLRYFTI